MRKQLVIAALVGFVIMLLLLWSISIRLGKIETNTAVVANVVDDNEYDIGRIKIAGAPGAASITEGIDESGDTVELTVYSAEAWCPPCQRFVPVWENLKTSFLPKNKVMFRKINCNERPLKKEILDQAIFKDGGTIEGFPTVTLRRLKSDGSYTPEERITEDLESKPIAEQIVRYQQTGKL
jgi:thiol-disulfide isomerase/thioredoxin